MHLDLECDPISLKVGDDGLGLGTTTTDDALGLSLMRSRLEAMGGTLGLNSSPGDGTTVVALIPRPIACAPDQPW